MTDLILPRRKFLTGLASLIAAPAIVRASSLMPVKSVTIYKTAALATEPLHLTLQRLTRQAFIPSLYTQIVAPDPLIRHFLETA